MRNVHFIKLLPYLSKQKELLRQSFKKYFNCVQLAKVRVRPPVMLLYMERRCGLLGGEPIGRPGNDQCPSALYQNGVPYIYTPSFTAAHRCSVLRLFRLSIVAYVVDVVAAVCALPPDK